MNVKDYFKSLPDPEFSGKTSSCHHKRNDTPNPVGVTKGLREVKWLDAQWSDCPIEVENAVKRMWRWFELGNDDCFFRISLKDIKSYLEEDIEEVDQRIDGEWVKVPLNPLPIAQYILSVYPDIDEDEQVYVHWWW